MSVLAKHNGNNGNGNGTKPKRKGNPGWVKGVSGNPNGRPKKGHTLTDLLAKHLDKEEFCKAIVAQAMDGNNRCIQEIFERLDGKVTEHVETDTVLRVEYVETSGRSEIDGG